MIRKLSGSFGWPLSRQRGIAVPVVVVSLAAIMAMAGISVDVGYILWNQKRLNAAVDAAALAAAQDLWTESNWSTVTTTVDRYAARHGGVTSSQNTLAIDPAYVNAPVSTGLRLNSVARSANRFASGFNAIRVTQTARVPLVFLPALGIPEKVISATATASAGGGGAPPINVSIVVDTTGSMTSNNVSCSPYGTLTRLNCAKKGMQDLVKTLKARGNTVGLVAFPPRDSAASVAENVNCPSDQTSSDLSLYMAGADRNYPWRDDTNSISSIIPWANATDYISNNNFNTSHNLIRAIGGVSSCTGLEAPGGVGTFYAQAVRQAQDNFSTLSNGQQNVMVVLSDGDADGDMAPDAVINGEIYDGTCIRFTATNTSGSSLLTGVSIISRTCSYENNTDNGTLGITSILAGETITGGDFPSSTTVVSASGSTVTLSNTATRTRSRTFDLSTRSGPTLRVNSLTPSDYTLAVGKKIDVSGTIRTITAMSPDTGCINASTQCTGAGGARAASGQAATYRLSGSHNITIARNLNVVSQYQDNQCQQAVVAANDAKRAGTLVYAIAFGASDSSGCGSDTTTLSPLTTTGNTTRPCNTLQWMAGDHDEVQNARPTTLSKYFYSTGGGCNAVSGNSNASLAEIFEDIGQGLMGSRIIPDDAD